MLFDKGDLKSLTARHPIDALPGKLERLFRHQLEKQTSSKRDPGLSSLTLISGLRLGTWLLQSKPSRMKSDLHWEGLQPHVNSLNLKLSWW